jgi:hypothetical protein
MADSVVDLTKPLTKDQITEAASEIRGNLAERAVFEKARSLEDFIVLGTRGATDADIQKAANLNAIEAVLPPLKTPPVDKSSPAQTPARRP